MAAAHAPQRPAEVPSDADASWTSPPWGPHRLVPEAERWRRTQEVHDKLRKRVDELEAALEAERRKRKEVEVNMSEDINKWRLAARQMEIERDSADKLSKMTTVDSMAKVSKNKWDCIEQVTDADSRVRALEKILEEERSAHFEELQRYAKLLEAAQDDAEARVQLVRRLCDDAVAAARQRAEEAEELAATAQRRADEQVAANRQRESRHIAETRHLAGDRVRESEQHRQADVDQLRQRVVQQERELEDRLRMNEHQKAAAINEVNRHLTAMDHDHRDLCDAYSIDFDMKAAHLREYQERQRTQNKAVASHHKALLDTEKTLHGRTMERTMGRVVRHMQMSDGDTRGSDTPTREFLRTYPFPLPTAREPPRSARGLGSPLKRIGGAVVSDGVSGLASD